MVISVDFESLAVLQEREQELNLNLYLLYNFYKSYQFLQPWDYRISYSTSFLTSS